MGRLPSSSARLMVLKTLRTTGRWLEILQLTSDAIGQDGAAAVALALKAGAFPRGRRLWMCGAFSKEGDEEEVDEEEDDDEEELTVDGNRRYGFRLLTTACDDRELALELDHGLVWGM